MTDPETPDALAPDAEPSPPTEPDADALARAESDAAAEAAAVDSEAAVDAAADRQALVDNDELDDVLTSNDYSVAFSPRQVAVGLAIVAGLVAVVAARRRRKRSGEGDNMGAATANLALARAYLFQALAIWNLADEKSVDGPAEVPPVPRACGGGARPQSDDRRALARCRPPDPSRRQ